MKFQEYIDEGDGSSEKLLKFIYDAFEAGDGVAVDQRYLDVLNRISFCHTCAAGVHEGCYLFPGITERSRVCRLFDKLVAFVAVIALLPLFAAIFLLVLVMDGFPVVFRQQRFGVDNSSFDIYKFRTMVLKGEKLHGKMQRRWGKEGKLFKMEKDPRATPFGSILRASYLDELPQLFNVLKGDMRLCGPRPLPESDMHHYTEGYHNLRLRGVPGITGLWQLGGSGEINFDEMCLLDLYYLCNNSLRFDMGVLLQTVKLLFTRRS